MTSFSQLAPHIFGLQTLAGASSFQHEAFFDRARGYQEALETAGIPTGFMDQVIDLVFDPDRESEMDETVAQAAVETLRGQGLFPKVDEDLDQFHERLEGIRQANLRIQGASGTPPSMSRLFLSRERLLEMIDAPENARELVPGYKIFYPLSDVNMNRTAEVFQAFDEVEQRMVALKIYRPFIRVEGMPFNGMFNELRFQANPPFRNIVRAEQVGRTRLGGPYVVFELMAGGMLRRLMTIKKAEKASFEDVIPYLRQMINGAAMVHAHGIVHRDIKPDNLLLSRDMKEMKWTDFGLAMRAEEKDRFPATLGTASYLPPEPQNDYRRDVYSLGLTLYEFLTYTRSYQLKESASQFAPSELKPRRRIPKEMDALVRRAAENDPEKRFPSAVELAEDFEEAFG